MSELHFNIGDTVYMADYNRHEHYITCPDCLGSKRVKVVLGDGTEVSIECGGCNPGGYQASTGAIKQYAYDARAIKHIVTGYRVSGGAVEYELDGHNGGCYLGDESKVFATEAEAIAKAESLKDAIAAEENRRLLAKTKDEKSWKWNYSYHLRGAKEAQRQLDYHNSKATICKAKYKEPE